MLFDVLDNVFLLHFALEPAERAFDRFALLNLDFSHEGQPLFEITKCARLSQVSADSRRESRRKQRNTPLVSLPVCNRLLGCKLNQT